MDPPSPLSTQASPAYQRDEAIGIGRTNSVRAGYPAPRNDYPDDIGSAMGSPLAHPSYPVSPGIQTGDWIGSSRRPSAQTMAQFPPLFAPTPNHIRHGSSATQPEVETAGSFREAGVRSRSATQPGLEPRAFATYAARSPFDDPTDRSDPEPEAPPPTHVRRASAYTEPPASEPARGPARARSLSGSSRLSSSSSRAPSRYDHRRTPSRAKHLTRVAETHESFDEARMAQAAPGAVPAALQPGPPYGPGQDPYPAPQQPYPPAQGPGFPVGTGQGREDPRVQALLEALRINARDNRAPPPETRRPPEPARGSSHIELRTILDAIRAQPQRWSLPRNPSPPPPGDARAGSSSSRPSVSERRAGPPLEIAAGKAVPTVTATAVNSASTGSKPGWTHAPAPGISPPDSKWGERASHVERQGRRRKGDEEDNSWFVADADQPAGHTKEFDQPMDKNLVTWDGPDDPANPSNWPMGKKYATSLILSVFSFIAPFSATMLGPALDVIGTELAIPEGPQRQLVSGLQVLAAGIGPFFCAPLIEAYGRVPMIRYGHIWHLVWNTACGFATTGPQLMAFRFLGGIGASATQILPPGLTADIYPARMGGLGDSVHNYLPFFGSAVAPIFGAFVTQESDWRWIFWGTSIFSIFAIALAFFCLEESLHPVLLERKAARLRRETGNPHLYTPFQTPGQSRQEWMAKKVALPYLMLLAHPIVQVPFAYRAYLYGIMYLMISIFDKNFVEFYNMDKGSASLNFLALGTGFVAGLHISRYAIDGTSAYFRRKKNTDGHEPEWRLPVNAGAGLLVPAALMLYGWSVQQGLHYMVPNVAAVLLGIGLIQGYFSLQPYVTESYGLEYASSAHCVAAGLQHVAEFAFPLFGPPLYAALGLGWANTLLAILTLAICILVPLVLWHFGPALRRISTRGLPVVPSARQ